MGVRGRFLRRRADNRWRTNTACSTWPTRTSCALFDEIQPDIIVPEVEASPLRRPPRRGAQVVPSAEIAAICMDRERLRVLAHEELGLPTTPYRFAGSLEELREGANRRLSMRGQPDHELLRPRTSVGRFRGSDRRGLDRKRRKAAAHDEGDVSRVIVEALAHSTTS